MSWHNFTEDRCIERLVEEATYIEAKSGQLSPRLSTWCGVAVKKLSDEVKIVANIVSQEYTTAPGSIRKSEMLSHLEGRLRELIECDNGKCEKLLDTLNEGSVVVRIVLRTQHSKKIKSYHDRVKRIRAELETTITRMKISWGQHADTSRGSRTEEQPNLVVGRHPPATTPTLGQIAPASTNGSNRLVVNNNSGDEGEGAILVQPMSQTFSTPLPGLLINEITVADASPRQAGAETLSSPFTETITPTQEAPSASLRVGNMSLNTVGNDVNNSTTNDHSWHTGNGNSVILNIEFNIEHMVFNLFG
ncbi:hypothetical protein BT96DRAFT_982162 [Gymnopus androsaceus JB14]|uniref:Uncharacterized protein n=1 Tax=Gymnopus androsaceus JB14 TaxID=1447944 RepID=A0A6A4GHS4_9AGAR|nr:hypothetical protein BT96DRAFT_982162 [Gymnopus androsaceus JB14]